ncbi:sensor histidine kinase [Spongiivirga sp. MCCC 1A20706]|uniref:tetratricopeptide repeat-containing sensor histidine kinase n=1 Tax=Spongiivirga sp. MCCC 1A20706 TaxID=3160963 RepID=UPI003977A001
MNRINYWRFFFLFLIVQNAFPQPQKTQFKAETLTALHETLKTVEKSNDDLILTIAEKAQQLQSNLQKEAMTPFLETLSQLVDLQDNARLSFIYHIISSRNLLFYHKYEMAIELAEKAIHLKEHGAPEENIYLYTTLGTCYYYTANYEKALTYHLKALDICSTSEISGCSSGIYNNMSVVYMGLADWDKSQRYTQLALDSSETTKNDFERSRAIGNMAIIFAEQGEFEESEKWFLKDLEMDFESGDSISAARNYNNLGILYEYQNKHKKALEFCEKGLALAKAMNDEASIALGYQNVGNAHRKLGNTQQALDYFQLGMKMTQSLGNRDKLRDAYFNLSEFYETIGNYKNANKYLMQYIDLNDSIVGENHLNAIKKIEIEYETQKKENEILKLSEKQLINERTIATQNRWVKQLFFGLIAVLILGILSFFIYKQRLQNKKQEELILAISETQTEERKRIAQDLHDSIGGALALAKNKVEAAADIINPEQPTLTEAIHTLIKTSNQVRQISHNLMPGELVRFGLAAAISTLLEQLNTEALNAQFYSTKMEQRIEPVKEVQLYRIVQETLQNVLKHAKAKNVFVQLNKHKNFLSLMIEDDGIGFKETTNKGLGISNIEQRIKMLKGTFNIDSKLGIGTTINIQVPV